MPRFAHLADIHLGGWKQQPMQDLNFKAFQKAIDRCIKANLDFILIAGDLFDTAYPGIDVLKKAFAQFKKLKEAKIPCYIIAGSHDYSVSGKTFLDVLEEAGFCKNVANFEEKEGEIILNPTLHQGVALYGYPGKKSGLEIQDLRRMKINQSPGMFQIFLLHTTIENAKGTLPIDSLNEKDLPYADYYALGHLHINFKKDKMVYPGPVFPNNFQELEDLEQGGFYIIDSSETNPLEKVELKTKELVKIKIEITDALEGTQKIIEELDKYELKDKIVLLRIYGELEKGKNSDIDYIRIGEHIKKKEAYYFLRNTHDLRTKQLELESEFSDLENSETIENETIEQYSKENPSKYNELISQLMYSLEIEKQEGETTSNFKNRLIEESRKILKY